MLWEVFNTSETEQEEGGILTSAAECLARIRSAKASQTKTVLLVRRSARMLPRILLADSHYMISPFLIKSICYL